MDRPALKQLVDRTENRDVDPAAEVGQSGPACHQDQSAIPDRNPLVARHQRGTGNPGRGTTLHRRWPLATTMKRPSRNVAIAGNGIGKPRPFGKRGSRLQSKSLWRTGEF